MLEWSHHPAVAEGTRHRRLSHRGGGWMNQHRMGIHGGLIF